MHGKTLSEIQATIGALARSSGCADDGIRDHLEIPTQTDKNLAACMFEYAVVSRKAEQVRSGVVPELHPLVRENLMKLKSGQGYNVLKVLSKLALIGTELTKAGSCVVHGQMLTTFRESDGKPEGLGNELAGIVIRVLQLADDLDLDMETEIKAEILYQVNLGLEKN